MVWTDFLMVLLGLSFIRVLIRWLIPKMNDYYLDSILFAIFIIGSVITWRGDIERDKENMILKSSLQSAQESLKNNEGELKDTKSQLENIYKEKQDLEELKKTLPYLRAELSISRENKFQILIKPINKVPFEWQWEISNRDNTSIIPIILLDWAKIYPDTGKTYLINTDVKLEEAKENYVQLKIRYRSIYVAEMNFPKYLQGAVIRQYTISEGVLKKLEE